MLTPINAPNVQLPLPVQVAAFQGVPSPEAAATARITLSAPPASANAVAVFNNSRNNNSTQPSQTVAPAPAVSILSGSEILPRIPTGSGTINNGFSATFLTQILAQSDTFNRPLIIGLFSQTQPNSPTPDQLLLERFAITKYFPSFAFKPAPSAPQPTANNNVAVPAPALTTQPIIIRDVPAADLSTSFANNVDVSDIPLDEGTEFSSIPAATATQRRFSNERFAIRGNSSFITPTGVNAYQATQSRNSANLTPVSPVTPSASLPTAETAPAVQPSAAAG